MKFSFPPSKADAEGGLKRTDAGASVPAGAWGRQPSNKQPWYIPGHCLQLQSACVG